MKSRVERWFLRLYSLNGEDANTLLGLSAMISNRRARVEGEVNDSIVLPERDKEWEWMEDGQGRQRVR